MQNLPITPAIQAVAQGQAPNPADNNTTQAIESFDSVLARQRTNAGEPNKSTGARDKGQATLSPTDSASAATGNKLETPVTDAANTPPADVLAALLPATTNTNSVATLKKSVPQAPTPDGASTLPSDMLAALLSTQQNTSVTAQKPIATGVQSDAQQPVAASAQSGTQQPTAMGAQGDTQQPIPFGVQGDTQQSVALGVQGGMRQHMVTDVRGNAQRPVSTVGEQAAPSLLRAQGDSIPPVADAHANQGKTFSTVLEALGKDAANTATSASAAQTSTHAVLPDATALTSQTQSTTSLIAASTNGPVQAVVNTPVTHDAWGNEFNQKITWLATQHEQTAELHLNPPHLGPMDVVLNISGDQATALFTSPHAAVRDAVEQALPKLREMLADNGIMLGNATVSDQSPKEQPTWLADKQVRGNTGLRDSSVDAISASSTILPVRRHQGMVDTFA